MMSGDASRSSPQADAVERRVRGLIAIAIADSVAEHGLKPTTWPLTTARSFFGVFTKLEAPSLRSARNRGILWVTLAILAALVLPLMLPIELIRSRRVDRHNRDMLAALKPVSASLQAALAGGKHLFAVVWRAWVEGTPQFSGAAIAVAEGGDAGPPTVRVVWLTAARGGSLPAGVDAAAVQRALREQRFTHCRFEWEAHDPFEAVERELGPG